MATSESKEQPDVFSHNGLRILVGVIAFLLPPLVWLVSSVPLTSISASYYTKAQDIFVGSLFAIAAVFFAYNGYSIWEAVISKLGSVAAVCAALYPTACDTCVSDTKSTIHLAAAIILFGTIVYFCWGPFRIHAIAKTNNQDLTETERNDAKLRIPIYWICGIVTATCMLIVAAKFIFLAAMDRAWSVTYWAEFISLWAFAFAWLVAGKIITLVRGKLTIKL